MRKVGRAVYKVNYKNKGQKGDKLKSSMAYYHLMDTAFIHHAGHGVA